MEDNILTIIDHKNRTITISHSDLVNLVLANFEVDIDVTDIQASVDGAGFEVESYDAEIWALEESMDDAIANALEDAYSSDKFNPKAKNQ